MKRAIPNIVAVASALGLVGASAVAQQADPVPSNAAGALEAPENWHCDRIRPEYSEYLEEGNAPQDWRYVRQNYRDVSDDRIYTWQDWLDWADDAGCGADYVEPQPNAAIGLLMSFFGAGLIAASGGERAISPG